MSTWLTSRALKQACERRIGHGATLSLSAVESFNHPFAVPQYCPFDNRKAVEHCTRRHITAWRGLEILHPVEHTPPTLYGHL